jgi:hypothetical protein
LWDTYKEMAAPYIPRQRLDPDKAAERVYNFLHTLTMVRVSHSRSSGVISPATAS